MALGHPQEKINDPLSSDAVDSQVGVSGQAPASLILITGGAGLRWTHYLALPGGYHAGDPRRRGGTAVHPRHALENPAGEAHSQKDQPHPRHNDDEDPLDRNFTRQAGQTQGGDRKHHARPRHTHHGVDPESFLHFFRWSISKAAPNSMPADNIYKPGYSHDDPVMHHNSSRQAYSTNHPWVERRHHTFTRESILTQRPLEQGL